MARLLVGLALLPTAALTVGVALQSLGLLASRSASAIPFLAGLGLSVALWLFGRYAVLAESGAAGLASAAVRKLYIFGHELTHALAAWSVGASVLGFKVGESGGHVDLSHSSAFIALAPYCVPIYTLLCVAGYRLWLWLNPGSPGQAAFLLLMGLTLSFHLLKTFETLWDRRQPDLAAAGGVVFSLSWIALANGLVVLLLIKTLFPSALAISGELQRIGALTAGFWTSIYVFLEPLKTSFVAQLKR